MNAIKKVRRKIMLLVAALAAFSIVLSSAKTFAEEVVHWGYGGVENPTRWSRLSPEFAMCELGGNQSPINIEGSVIGKPGEIVFNYKPAPLVVSNNGHTIQMDYAPGSKMTINGKEYTLLQFHFHTPSEHTVQGEAAPMEVHLVHRNAEGQLAVVGVMMQEGGANPLIDKAWKHIPSTETTNTVSNITINAADLLPKSNAHFSYIGSLTTPPCSEGVKWTVLVEPITVSTDEIGEFQELYHANARPVQPVNNRVVELHRE